jgi:hypothetical protein
VPPSFPKTRKQLSADALIRTLKARLEQLPDQRTNPTIPLEDALLSAFAMFSLKDPSLLAFDKRRPDQNLKHLYRIGQIPCDTQMREILDPVNPEALRPAFPDVFRQLQRGKALEKFVFHQDCYLLALDGTGYFSSTAIHCDSCLEKTNKQTGQVTYSHQMLAAAIVHPEFQEVIPLAPEPITKQDGSTKNDCERNASKRLLKKIRREHPHLKFLVIEDGLASNAPHIRELENQGMHYLLGVKPGDHEFLFQYLLDLEDADQVTTLSGTTFDQKRWEIRLAHDLPLNEAHRDLRVNFLEYAEFDDDGEVTKRFSWVTDLTITKRSAPHLVRGGRTRWKIENETINTLKNQGYQFEHNFGHGEQNLSVVFAMLMMLAFLVDQTQQLCCPLFQALWQKAGSKRALWEQLRSHVYHFVFDSFQHLYEVMLSDAAKGIPPPAVDSS